MSNCKYLIENIILYSKQFGFQDGHSTENALVLLGKQIIESMLNKRLRHLLPYQRILTLETTPFSHKWVISYLSNGRQSNQIYTKEKT